MVGQTDRRCIDRVGSGQRRLSFASGRKNVCAATATSRWDRRAWRHCCRGRLCTPCATRPVSCPSLISQSPVACLSVCDVEAFVFLLAVPERPAGRKKRRIDAAPVGLRLAEGALIGGDFASHRDPSTPSVSTEALDRRYDRDHLRRRSDVRDGTGAVFFLACLAALRHLS